ncbi:MAG: hypothetical protein P857_660 [Candidatus Xenolissoclinum pacificiensis L6]|uniref:Uncharacterized protein n=1 Tax=Candidatus Xenolissoclinum pacificiensis L6 TaxID=1401685 RepID=W2V0J0_9RICK|nr:MAG: hypothetical protein P857_660 [Candidatus Xenolissoclinum pacificiensis L6]
MLLRNLLHIYLVFIMHKYVDSSGYPPVLYISPKIGSLS